MNDRRVHAVTVLGAEVVRYDRAGKWYIEFPDGRRKAITLSEAVRRATASGSLARVGIPGGGAFDAALRRLGAA